MSPLGCPHYFWFPHLRSGLFGFCQPGHRKKTSNSPFIRPSVSQSVESSIHQPFNHSLVSTVVTHSHSSGGSGRSRAGADGAELRQPRCTIPWCASMKTNWYLPDTWDWLSSIKGAAAVVWVSDWMARMRCLHFEFTCLPRPRCHLDYLYPAPQTFGRWPELIFNYESSLAFYFAFEPKEEQVRRLWLSHSVHKMLDQRLHYLTTWLKAMVLLGAQRSCLFWYVLAGSQNHRKPANSDWPSRDSCGQAAAVKLPCDIQLTRKILESVKGILVSFIFIAGKPI